MEPPEDEDEEVYKDGHRKCRVCPCLGTSSPQSAADRSAGVLPARRNKPLAPSPVDTP